MNKSKGDISIAAESTTIFWIQMPSREIFFVVQFWCNDTFLKTHISWLVNLPPPLTSPPQK